jgi:hypothetical protein
VWLSSTVGTGRGVSCFVGILYVHLFILLDLPYIALEDLEVYMLMVYMYLVMCQVLAASRICSRSLLRVRKASLTIVSEACSPFISCQSSYYWFCMFQWPMVSVKAVVWCAAHDPAQP